jgi:tetratricopeptide (TPR) repeat protein
MSARSATSASHSTDKRNIPKRCSARIALQPDFVQAHGNRGTTLRELNRPKEAEEAYRQALALRPNEPETLDNLASERRARGTWYRKGRTEGVARSRRRAHHQSLSGAGRYVGVGYSPAVQPPDS